MPPLRFQTIVIHWRGPSPFYFGAIPAAHVAEVAKAAKRVTYGWGMIPVEARIADVRFTTSLFPKDQGYLLPIKAAVRKTCDVTVGDTINVELSIGQGSLTRR